MHSLSEQRMVVLGVRIDPVQARLQRDVVIGDTLVMASALGAGMNVTYQRSAHIL